MRTNKVLSKIMAAVLSITMMFTAMPLTAAAEDNLSGDASAEITAFTPLDETVAQQFYAPGTAQSEFNLPESLMAAAVNSESGEETETTVTVSAWHAEPAYDPDTKGDYVFSPELSLTDGYSLADTVTLPTVTVTVKELQGFVRSSVIVINDQADWETYPDNTIFLNDGDTLVINANAPPTNPTTIIISGASATIMQSSMTTMTNVWIDADPNCKTLTLDSLKITAPADKRAILLEGSGAKTLTVRGTVSITGGTGLDALYSEGNLTIEESTLNAVGGDGNVGGNGIAGNTSGSNITISAKVNATGGNGTSGSGGKGITTGTSGDITINTETTATGGNGSTSGGIGIYASGKVAINAKTTATGGDSTSSSGGNGGVGIYGNVIAIASTAPQVTATGGDTADTSKDGGHGVFANDTMPISGKLTATGGDGGNGGNGIYARNKLTINAETTATGGDSTSIDGGNGGRGIYGNVIAIASQVTATGGSATLEKGIGSYGVSGVDITISGKLTATGGNGSSGGGGIYSLDKLTISAETTATGGDGTSGNSSYGYGGYGIYGSNIITITSSAPQVTATGGKAKGTNGDGGNGVYADGNITISGKLTAKGGDSANKNGGAGILSVNGAVTINSSASLVKATGGKTDSTGGSNGGDGISAFKKITILSELEATGGDADVGVGGIGVCSFNDGITVSSKLTATGGSVSGAGGDGGYGVYSNGTVTINKTATVTAKGGDAAADGGSGDGLSCGLILNGLKILPADITVYGKLTATGGNSMDGRGGDGIVGVGNITIDSVITAHGGSKGSADASYFDGAGIILIDLPLIAPPGLLNAVSGKLMLTNNSKGSVITSGGASIGDIVANYITLPKGSTYTLNGYGLLGPTPNPIKVTYLDPPTNTGGGSSSGGGGASTPRVINGNINGQSLKITQSTTADGNKTANVTVNAREAQTAVEKAVAAAEQSGQAPTVIITIPAVSGSIDAQTSISVTISAEAIAAVAGSQNTSLTLNTPAVNMTFDSSAVQTIAGAAVTGDVTINANVIDTNTLTEEQQAQIGDRPVYDFSVTADGKPITDFNGNVTVSIPYTPKAGENPNAIVIYFIGSDGTLHCIENGLYDPATGKVSFTTNHFSLYMIGYNPVTFNDIPETHWGRPAIEKSAARGLVSGVGGGKYDPDRAISRAEFVQMIQNALKLPSADSSATGYADVTSTAWYYKTIMSAKSAGLLDGLVTEGNNFLPNQPIAREEMAAILANIAIYKGADTTGATYDLTKFSDFNAMDNKYLEELALAIKLGLLSESGVGGGRFDPKGLTTRAQAAQIQMNLLNIFKQ